MVKVGTEQSIRPFTPEELESLLSDLKSNLGKYSLGELIIDNKNKAQATERGWGIMFDSEKLKYKCNEIFTNELFYRLTDDEYIYFTKLEHSVRRL